MASSSQRRSTTIIIIGAIIVIIAAIIVGANLVADHVRRAEDTAYRQGSYDHAYDLLEETWEDSRVALVHATLIAGSCKSGSGTPYCDLFKSQRDRVAALEMPEKVTEGDANDFLRAVIDADSVHRQLHAGITQLEVFRRGYEDHGMDPETADLVDEAMDHAKRAQEGASAADEWLIEHPGDADVREAKERVDGLFARYAAETGPSDWGPDDLEHATAEMEDAAAALDEALLNGE